MKIILTIALACIISCKSNPDVIKVNKYLTKKGRYSKEITHKLIQSSIYNVNNDLIERVDYSRTGCNLIDSSIFVYSNKQLIEQLNFAPKDVTDDCKTIWTLANRLKFVYQNDNKPLKIEVIKGDRSDYLKYQNGSKLPVIVRDSLLLLREYLQPIYKINHMFNSKTTGVSKQEVSYSINEALGIFSEYGIPTNELMLSFKLVVKDGRLLEDETRFTNYTFRRIYSYNNGILSTVSIENNNLDGSHRLTAKEIFVVE